MSYPPNPNWQDPHWPQAQAVPYQPGFGQPGPPPVASPFLVQLGDLRVTHTEIVTPSGSMSLTEADVWVVDQTIATQKTPTWAVVMAVITAWFALLGLLFLLAKEPVVQGYVIVTVESGGRRHVMHVPIANAAQRADVMQRAAYIQQLATYARQQH
ncbi:hypothetical protein [Serinibacter arcticus]|uniref:hypothetical protein n=1 Tax=Serinibacter arcticus TaxID=1655435 RepID=UPI0010920C87|nr:hypothetical protein [Serinibacter arcticus]